MPTFPAPLEPIPATRPRFQKLRVVTALVLRGMTTRFGNSAGGYLWAILEPLGGIMLLSVAFSLALRSPPLGSSFILFYTTGMIPFSMYRSMSSDVASAVSSNRGLLTYPVVSAVDAVLAKLILGFLTIMVTALLLNLIIIWGGGMHVSLDLAPIALALGLAALLGLGVGTMNCVLFRFFPTWKNIWAVLTRPLFIVSGIFFTFESAPKAFQQILWYNPLVHIIGVARSGYYAYYNPQFVSLTYVIGLSLGLFVVGGWLIRRHESALMED